MAGLVELARTVGSLPLAGLVALVLLGGFALSAFAIYIVGKIATTRTNGGR